MNGNHAVGHHHEEKSRRPIPKNNFVGTEFNFRKLTIFLPTVIYIKSPDSE